MSSRVNSASSAATSHHQSQSEIDYSSVVPDEIWVHVLKNLKAYQLLSCSSLSRKFYQIAKINHYGEI